MAPPFFPSARLAGLLVAATVAVSLGTVLANKRPADGEFTAPITLRGGQEIEDVPVRDNETFVTFCHEGGHELQISRAISGHTFSVTAFRHSLGRAMVEVQTDTISPGDLPFRLVVQNGAGVVKEAWRRVVKRRMASAQLSPYGRACVRVESDAEAPNDLTVTVVMGRQAVDRSVVYSLAVGVAIVLAADNLITLWAFNAALLALGSALLVPIGATVYVAHQFHSIVGFPAVLAMTVLAVVFACRWDQAVERVVSFLEARADARWWLLLYFSASLALCGAYWLSKGPAQLVPRTPYKRSALRLSVLALGCACLFGACRHPLAGVVVVCVALLLRSQTSAASLGATVLDTASLFFPDQHPSQRRKTTVAPMTDKEMIQQSLRHTADELSGLQRFASQHR